MARELRLGRVRDPRGAALGGHVATTCPDCGEAIEVDVGAGRPAPLELVFHVVVPARRWWDDIGFT